MLPSVLIDSNLMVKEPQDPDLFLEISKLYQDALENYMAQFHVADAALLFNSGYDANVGFFWGVPRGSHTMTNYVRFH
jgi:8-amino-7-oxononanoate synthase